MCIHLLSTINSDYQIPFRVLEHSLLASKLPGTEVRWHICETGLSAVDRESIESAGSEAKVEFRWYRLSDREKSKIPSQWQGSAKLLERLFMPDRLVGKVDRLIYLDVDLLVLDRLEDLWEVDLGGAILGAVQDLAVPLVSSPMGLERHATLGFTDADPYFNAGMFVADVDAWRRNRVCQRALEYLDRFSTSINLLDQDALNAVIENCWAPLDYRWNLTASLAARMHFRPKHVDQPQLERAIDDPGIVHFSGYLKPWVYTRLGSRWAATYGEHLREVFPEHQPDQTLKGRSISFYDRHLRRLCYPLETALWARMRGF